MCRKTSYAIGLLIFLTAVSAIADKLILVKSKEKTSNEIPLEFILQKTRWDGKDIWIWGAVENSTSKTYENVKVRFAAKGRAGKLFGRKAWDTDPTAIKPGQTGYIDEQYVRCEHKIPYSLEYKVTGQ
jgi:hypothetical protein